MPERHEDDLPLRDPIHETPIPHADLEEALELRSLEGLMCESLHRRSLHLVELPEELPPDCLVELLELGEKLVQVLQRHFVRRFLPK